jgi:hypothetical protein
LNGGNNPPPLVEGVAEEDVVTHGRGRDPRLLRHIRDLELNVLTDGVDE